MPAGLAALDSARELNGAAEQQEFFGERGLARVGVGNDGKRAPPRRLLGDLGHADSGRS